MAPAPHLPGRSGPAERRHAIAWGVSPRRGDEPRIPRRGDTETADGIAPPGLRASATRGRAHAQAIACRRSAAKADLSISLPRRLGVIEQRKVVAQPHPSPRGIRRHARAPRGDALQGRGNLQPVVAAAPPAMSRQASSARPKAARLPRARNKSRSALGFAVLREIRQGLVVQLRPGVEGRHFAKQRDRIETMGHTPLDHVGNPMDRQLATEATPVGAEVGPQDVVLAAAGEGPGRGPGIPQAGRPYRPPTARRHRREISPRPRRSTLAGSRQNRGPFPGPAAVRDWNTSRRRPRPGATRRRTAPAATGYIKAISSQEKAVAGCFRRSRQSLHSPTPQSPVSTLHPAQRQVLEKPRPATRRRTAGSRGRDGQA